MTVVLMDYAGVAALRDVLAAQAADLWSASWAADGPDAACLARVSAACEVASDALFDAMNKAHSYLGDPDAAAVLDGWLGR